MQEEIDKGLQYCEACDRFGIFTFCGHCGRRFVGHGIERRRCSPCGIEAATQYCPKCGEQLYSEYSLRWERGEVDLVAEGRRAMAALQRMVKKSPLLARDVWPTRPDLHPPMDSAADLVNRLNAGFGHGYAPPATTSPKSARN